MLGKLMKHEFRATGRFGLPLCGIMIALSAIAGMTLRFWDNGQYGLWEEAGSLLFVLYGLSILAVAIGVFIILIQHFKRNLLGDEGYLMRTLPVSMHELLLSKLFVALLWYAVSTLLIILSVLLVGVFSGEVDWAFFRDINWRMLREALSQLDASFWISLALWIVGSMALFTLLCYADLTLSQTFGKHRVLYGVAAVVILIVLLRLIFGLNSILDDLVFDPLIHAARNTGSSLGVIGGADGPTAIIVTSVGYHNIVGLIELYLANIGLYFLTWAFLKYRPNLE